MWQWKPRQLHGVGLGDPQRGLAGRAVRHGEPELRIVGAGGDVLVGVRLDAGRDPHQHARGGEAVGHEALDPVELVEGIDDDAADALLEPGPQLGLGLVVAVVDDAGGREPGPPRDVQLAAGGDVEVQTLLVDEAGHRTAQEGLPRIRHRVDAECVAVFPAPGAQLGLAVHVERRAERLGQPLDVAAADHQPPAFVDARAAGQQSQRDRRGHHSSSPSMRDISSGACTPRMASAFARPRRLASANHRRAWVSAASSEMTRQSR